jgi:hypothetical protein
LASRKFYPKIYSNNGRNNNEKYNDYNDLSASATPPPSSKQSRKLLIAVIAVIVIVLLIIGIYLAMGAFSTGPSGTSTPTPSTGVTATPTATATSSSTGSNIASASSLQYTVSLTNSSTGASLGSWTYYAKDYGTANFKMRIEFTDSSGSSVYIINGVLKEAWIEVDGQWTDLSSAYSSYYDSWSTLNTEYVNNLATWTGGDWTYSAGGETIRIYNISVNPSLADSLFEHS